jgi:hypothetical protein
LEDKIEIPALSIIPEEQPGRGAWMRQIVQEENLLDLKFNNGLQIITSPSDEQK